VYCTFICFMYNMNMTTKNYQRALYEAKQDMARLLVQREKLDARIARVHAVIDDLQSLCAELDHKHFEKRVDRVVKANLTMGMTEMSRVILKEKFFPMTAVEVKKDMEARKLDLSRYSNPLAVVHTVLKRLVKNGEAKVVPQSNRKKAYQWISATNKLLTELQQGSKSAFQQQGVVREAK
jgi:fibronectin type 3 domain-containing protein